MKGICTLENIPGTNFAIDQMGGATGMEFLDKVFYIAKGIMLGQIREITGLDGTTLQNWVKRGWVPNPTKKTYDKEQLARILLICMMRDTMQLSRVAFVLQYINGIEEEDRIIRESELYDIVCRVMTELTEETGSMGSIDDVIAHLLENYEEPVSGAKRRLTNGIRIISYTYYSAIIKEQADGMIDDLGAEKKRKR